MKYRFYTADVFTNRLFGGNGLAVFPDGRGLETAVMQQIAREFNLSETVFVLPPADSAHTRRLRIFTPGTEVPFAGHPTVGTGYVLATIGEVALQGETTRVIFEEGVGPVPVAIHARDGMPVSATLSAARRPEFGPPPPPAEVLAEMLSVAPSDLLSGARAPQAVSCGLPFLFVPVRDRGVLARLRLDLGTWERHLAAYWAPQIFIFAYDPELPGSDLRARMFGPAVGVAEDPATGSAASALAGYLGVRDTARDGTLHWRVEQGFEMGRPSILEVAADKVNGEIVAVRVGGECVMVSEGVMNTP